MFFRRIETPGLAQHSYYISDGGEAVVVDPRRDVDVYLDLARQQQDRVRFVLETHRNEDLVSGATALREATGARVLHGAKLDFEYGESMRDGDEIGAGRLTIRAIETPGHTDESLTFALSDGQTSSDPIMAFTGDALFVGTTGRTDLYGPDEARRLADALHRSLFDEILPLGDHVLLYPAHGPGSVCGAGMKDRAPSTLGIERLYNPDLQDADADDFRSRKLAEKHVRPPYFRRMEEWNLRGDAPVHLRTPDPLPLGPDDVARAASKGAIVVDTRMPQAFASGHVPGSYNIWQAGLTTYLGWLARPDEPIVLVTPEHAEPQDVLRECMRIGFDRVVGYLRGGFETWQNEGREVNRFGTIDTAGLERRLRSREDLVIVDVRTPEEHAKGMIEGSVPIFLGDLEARAEELQRDATIVTMCGVGHRGGVGASVLARKGFSRVYNYLGGWKAWQSS